MLGAVLLGMFVTVFVTYAEQTHDNEETWLDKAIQAVRSAKTCRGITTSDREV